MSMKLSDLEFIRLLPMWMRGDLANIGLSDGVNKVTSPLVEGFSLLPMWDRIDDLPESYLDEIAWEFNLAWYDKTANIETKRDLVKNGLKVWRHLGTKWAVETVITAYFGEGYIKEWFEYEGEPGHFAVYSSNPSVTNEKLQEFMYILNKVKRYSSHLDNIYITLTGEMPLSAGVSVHDVSNETYNLGAQLESQIIPGIPEIVGGGTVQVPIYPSLISSVVIHKETPSLSKDGVLIIKGITDAPSIPEISVNGDVQFPANPSIISDVLVNDVTPELSDSGVLIVHKGG